MTKVFASVVLAVGLASVAQAQNEMAPADQGTSDTVIRAGADRKSYDRSGSIQPGHARDGDYVGVPDQQNYDRKPLPTERGYDKGSDRELGKDMYLGLYGGLDLGQDTKSLARQSDNAGRAMSHAGGVVGLKAGGSLGWPFHNAVVYPDLELDFFYNGFAQKSADGDPGKATSIDSFVYMVNLLIKIDAGAFRPYAGLGLGGYYANVPVKTSVVVEHTPTYDVVAPGLENDDTGGFAWALIVGSDVLLTQRVSLFAEYKWLNFQNGWACKSNVEDVGTLGGKDVRFGQNLLTMGVRVHF